MEPQKRYLSWEEYFKLCDNLVEQIKDKGFTDIIAIARGGLIPAQYLAYKVDIKRIYNFGITTYSKKDTKLNEHDIVVYQQTCALFCGERKVLIVDDIADSGGTINKCYKDYLKYDGDSKKIQICTLHYKARSIVRPDYFAQEVDDNVWVVYPYDS